MRKSERNFVFLSSDWKKRGIVKKQKKMSMLFCKWCEAARPFFMRVLLKSLAYCGGPYILRTGDIILFCPAPHIYSLLLSLSLCFISLASCSFAFLYNGEENMNNFRCEFRYVLTLRKTLLMSQQMLLMLCVCVRVCVCVCGVCMCVLLCVCVSGSVCLCE